MVLCMAVCRIISFGEGCDGPLHCCVQDNRQLMTKQAKKAAKLEKKLKVLTGGYQVRGSLRGLCVFWLDH